jgi:hypothetical protein
VSASVGHNGMSRGMENFTFCVNSKEGIDTRDCGNNRTVALIPHCSQIMLRVLQIRMQPFLESETSRYQAGFQRKKGTRNHISNMRTVLWSANPRGKKIYFCFIDYSKAFD